MMRTANCWQPVRRIGLVVVNGQATSLTRAIRPRQKGAPPFHTVLLYEDLGLGDQAWEFYEKLTRKFEGDFAFRHLMWSFSVLGDPETLRLAVHSAADAHLVILSFSGRTELPATVKNWIARWIPLAKHKPALVTLMDPKVKAGPRAATHAYLREILEPHDINFFPHGTAVPRVCHLE